jgi:hypothetical protein
LYRPLLEISLAFVCIVYSYATYGNDCIYPVGGHEFRAQNGTTENECLTHDSGLNLNLNLRERRVGPPNQNLASFSNHFEDSLEENTVMGLNHPIIPAIRIRVASEIIRVLYEDLWCFFGDHLLNHHYFHSLQNYNKRYDYNNLATLYIIYTL